MKILYIETIHINSEHTLTFDNILLLNRIHNLIVDDYKYLYLSQEKYSIQREEKKYSITIRKNDTIRY